MGYLAQKRIVHRDLATRNILVDVDWHLKIADFGLSRETASRTGTGASVSSASSSTSSSPAPTVPPRAAYYRSTEGIFPLRWTALEAMTNLVYTEKTDVWSFGIVMAEIFQDGRQPYGTRPV